MYPKPPSFQPYRSLCCFKKWLTNDQLDAVERCVTRIVNDVVDLERTWTRQDQYVKDAVVEIATERCPFLADAFADAWPVEALVRYRLISIRKTRKARRATVEPKVHDHLPGDDAVKLTFDKQIRVSVLRARRSRPAAIVKARVPAHYLEVSDDEEDDKSWSQKK